MTPKDEIRFLDKFRVADGCWEWTAVRSNGYGYFYLQRHTRPAHRVSYELFRGPIPDGLVIDHLCENPGCVNPRHLEAVQHSVNIVRGYAKRPRTHCKRGHEYTVVGTYVDRDGGLICKLCSRIAGRERWRRQNGFYEKHGLTPAEAADVDGRSLRGEELYKDLAA